MISPQRFFMLIIMMNFILGTGIYIYNDPRMETVDLGLTYSDNEIEHKEGLVTEFDDDENVWTTSSAYTQTYENSIGAEKAWGSIILNVMKEGFWPLSISPAQFTNPIEKIFAYGLILFRTIMSVLTLLMVFLIIKNKLN